MGTEVNIPLGAEGSKSYGQRQRSKSPGKGPVAQSFLIGTAQLIKPAQLLDKGPAKLSCMMADMPPRGFDDLCLLHTWRTLNICIIWGY